MIFFGLSTFLFLPAHALKRTSSSLLYHLILPAKSELKLPKDFPQSLYSSGRQTKLPHPGQLLVGVSGAVQLNENTFLVLSDNGFGKKKNSADYALGIHTVVLDWKNEHVRLKASSFLHDPDKILPFDIIYGDTKQRYLTGADLDPESIQKVGNALYIGDEFGPYLIKTNLKGKVLKLWSTSIAGKAIRSPDHYLAKTSVNLPRSRGFEGLALSSDKRYLYPMLEGALLSEAKMKMEIEKRTLYILQFDLQEKVFSKKIWKYFLEQETFKASDFIMIDDRYGLVLEHDGRYGAKQYHCKKSDRSNCISKPAKFKRVYKVDFKNSQTSGVAKKVAFIDLLSIDDSEKKAKKGSSKGMFNFALDSPETLLLLSKNKLLLVNDNNFPEPRAREPFKKADHEFIVLSVEELMN